MTVVTRLRPGSLRKAPLYNIKGLLRHESVKTAEKYAHLQPDVHSAIESA